MSNVKLHVSVICCVKTTGSLLSATTLRCPKQPFSCCCESVSSHLWRVFSWTDLQQPPLSAFCWTGLDALPASCLNRNGVGTMGHLIDFFFPPATGKKTLTSTTRFPPLWETIPPPPHILTHLYILTSSESRVHFQLPWGHWTVWQAVGPLATLLLQSEGFIRAWVRSRSSFQVLQTEVRDDPEKRLPFFNLITDCTVPTGKSQDCIKIVRLCQDCSFQIFFFMKSKMADFLSLQKSKFNGRLINVSGLFTGRASTI